MILTDTSVWADHIRRSDPDLVELLGRGNVLMHPFVIEELACGHLPNRQVFLQRMHELPAVPIASHREVLALLANRKLFGTGLGSVDVHLLASTMLAGAKIWSRDKALIRESTRLGIGI